VEGVAIWGCMVDSVVAMDVEFGDGVTVGRMVIAEGRVDMMKVDVTFKMVSVLVGCV
jgi:hypothetical protein